MIPSSANLFLCGLSDEEDWQNRVGTWDSAYGLKFSCLKQHSLLYPSVDTVDPAKVVTNRMCLQSWNLRRCGVEHTEFETQLSFRSEKDCNLTALVGYFDVGYVDQNGEHKVKLSRVLCVLKGQPLFYSFSVQVNRKTVERWRTVFPVEIRVM